MLSNILEEFIHIRYVFSGRPRDILSVAYQVTYKFTIYRAKLHTNTFIFF